MVNEYKILVCGGRNYGKKWDYIKQEWRIDRKEVRRAYKILGSAVKYLPNRNIIIIHGAARGADTLAGRFVQFVEKMSKLTNAQNHPIYSVSERLSEWPFHADWNKYKKAAGPIRNRRMLKEGKPDLVIAFPGKKGTADMISISQKANVPVYKVGEK